MNTKITCPVCDRPEIEGNICPNCETDISLVRMLAELPEQEAKLPTKINLNMTEIIVIIVIALSLIFGVSTVFFAKEEAVKPPVEKPVIVKNEPEKPSEKPTAKTTQKPCLSAFNYTVQKGDSLFLIADKFYGDSNLINLILENNPQLKGRENEIEIGDKLLIPNVENNCSVK